MLKAVVAVKVVGPHRVWLTSEDAVAGEVDVAQPAAFGVFAALADPDRFGTVCVSAGSGIVGWPNGANLDANFFYPETTDLNNT